MTISLMPYYLRYGARLYVSSVKLYEMQQKMSLTPPKIVIAPMVEIMVRQKWPLAGYNLPPKGSKWGISKGVADSISPQ